MSSMKKIAVLLGYNGFGYNGLERSQYGRTVESDLLAAMAMVAANGNPAVRVAFLNISRGATTEINVHAAFQVISMEVAEEYAVQLVGNADAVNAALPKNGGIVLYSIKEMPSDFSARRNCDERTFDFYIPTYVFSPPPKETLYYSEPVKDPTPSELFPPHQESKNPVSTLVRSLSRKLTKTKSKKSGRAPEIIVPPADDSPQRSGTMTRLVRKLTKRNKKQGDEVASSITLNNDEGLVRTLTRTLSRKLTSRSAPSDNRVEPIHDSVVDAEMSQGPFLYDPLQLKAPNSEEMANIRAYRMTDYQYDTFKCILEMFRGTHNFHNYIPNATSPDDTMCYIRVLSADCSLTELHHGMEWIKVTLSAKAFAESQLRKMIALAVMVTRTNTPRSLVGNSFGFKNIDIPEFPAWGMVCSNISYETFCNENNVSLSASDVKDHMDSFTNRRILEFVRQMERDNMMQVYFNSSLLSWIRSLDSYSFLYSYYLNSKGVIGPRNNYIRPSGEQQVETPLVLGTPIH